MVAVDIVYYDDREESLVLVTACNVWGHSYSYILIVHMALLTLTSWYEPNHATANRAVVRSNKPLTVHAVSCRMRYQRHNAMSRLNAVKGGA